MAEFEPGYLPQLSEPALGSSGQLEPPLPDVPQYVDGDRRERRRRIWRRDRSQGKLPELTEADHAQEELLQYQHFVKEAPRFHDLLDDATRSNQLTYYPDTESTRTRDRNGSLHGAAQRSLNEHTAIVETNNFLQTAANLPGEMPLLDGYPGQTVQATARAILDNLHFVGERELDEAAAGLATHWKDYLLSDSKRKLCVPEDIIGTNILA